MEKIINFNPEGMKGLHFYIEGLNFPIAIGTYSDWEEVQVSYLSSNIKNGSSIQKLSVVGVKVIRFSIESFTLLIKVLFSKIHTSILSFCSWKENWIILSKKETGKPR